MRHHASAQEAAAPPSRLAAAASAAAAVGRSPASPAAPPPRLQSCQSPPVAAPRQPPGGLVVGLRDSTTIQTLQERLSPSYQAAPSVPSIIPAPAPADPRAWAPPVTRDRVRLLAALAAPASTPAAPPTASPAAPAAVSIAPVAACGWGLKGRLGWVSAPHSKAPRRTRSMAPPILPHYLRALRDGALRAGLLRGWLCRGRLSLRRNATRLQQAAAAGPAAGRGGGGAKRGLQHPTCESSHKALREGVCRRGGVGRDAGGLRWRLACSTARGWQLQASPALVPTRPLPSQRPPQPTLELGVWRQGSPSCLQQAVGGASRVLRRIHQRAAARALRER